MKKRKLKTRKTGKKRLKIARRRWKRKKEEEENSQ